MAFTDLTPSLQNIVMLNFEFLGKFIIIASLLIACILTVSNFKKTQKSPFAIMRFMQGILYVSSKIFLFMSPLTVLLLYPQVSINYVLQILLVFYTVTFSILGVIITINALLFGTAFINDFTNFNAQGNDIMNGKGNEIRKEVYQIVGHK